MYVGLQNKIFVSGSCWFPVTHWLRSDLAE